MVFIETAIFLRAIKDMTDEDLRALQTHLLEHPDAGAIIKGSGGLRKLRWASDGRGKRGGIRVIYFHINHAGQIYLVYAYAYAKNVTEDLSPTQLQTLRALIEED
jgi:hypothetical protein